jgi:hypothetical protein
VPTFTKGTSPTKILATDAYLFTSADLSSTAMPTLNGVQFSASASVGTMKSFVAKDIGPLTAWQLKIGDITTAVDQLWLVAIYTGQLNRMASRPVAVWLVGSRQYCGAGRGGPAQPCQFLVREAPIPVSIRGNGGRGRAIGSVRRTGTR